MKKIITLLVFLLGLSVSQGQWKSIAHYDRMASSEDPATMPWNITTKATYAGIRSVLVTDDLDGDGKLEIIATDYSNGGRVHVFEYVGDGNLELVWSAPDNLVTPHTESSPRWVQTGDLDGDGDMEIIFPVGPRYELGKLVVFEYKGSDNDYGTAPALIMEADQFVATDGLGIFRSDRERGTVFDFDSDGKDELIFSNEDKNVYIFGVTGNIGGFASWNIEGGDPIINPINGLSAGSHMQSIPVDYDGDGVKEIVNHHWAYYGFWSIEPSGTNQYDYPSAPNPSGVLGPTYYEFYKTRNKDATAFMGLAVADVDGDGKEEIAGLAHSTLDVTLISQPFGAVGVDVWDDSAKCSVIGSRSDYGLSSSSSFWGLYAADLNNNGKDEILVGGFYGENVLSFEYSGAGDILDSTSYNVSTVYTGEPEDQWEWLEVTIRDSAGLFDTSYSKGAWGNPGVMKMSHGDITGSGNYELVLALQQDPPYDSTAYTYQSWDGSAFVEDSVINRLRPRSVNLRIISKDGLTGVYENLDLSLVTPDDYVLEQNYPNPFNPTTTINFSLPLDKQISLTVYDVLGKEVKTLLDNEDLKKGTYQVTWDGTNNFNQKVASGNYIYTLRFGNFSKSAKMTLLK
ncbi:MAG: T9SS type A sorting domain-containing protein [Ignavibacteriae bacterium]|nr:T9SS C-terminal target domain-containing protein [Ignavibacteriota bacterium]NOG99342.1 T9SS type A sorting domain-containing protein [Ignavibacteriota bacterium]